MRRTTRRNENRRAVERISVDAESENGRDLLDDYLVESILDASGRSIGSRVKIYLKGKVARDGLEKAFVQ